MWLFFGFVVGFSFWYIVFPQQNVVNFNAQIEVFCAINNKKIHFSQRQIDDLYKAIDTEERAKKLMSDVELVQERKPMQPKVEDQQEALEMARIGAQESGIGERKLIRRTLLGALGLFPLPFIVMLRDLGPAPRGELKTTAWTRGLPIVTDISYQKIRPDDIPVGNLVSAMPENILEIQHQDHNLNERGKSAIILVRMRPEDIKSQQGEGWDYQGILAFSKICTHAGCPIALYEQRTHHLLCPCHQSIFDLSDSAQAIFGPARRRLPQLAIEVNSEGYLVARAGFQEPVGPSFWERS
jgi:ubiquinol-cytochrome c reductase iron-sulfur subunit